MESYGFNIGGNASWLRVAYSSEIDRRSSNIGYNIGLFVLWDSPVQGRLKSHLQFRNSRFIYKTKLSEFLDNSRIQFDDKPINFYTEVHYISLLLAPIFDLSALRMNNFYINGGIKLDFLVGYKKDVYREVISGKTVTIEDNTTEQLDSFAYGVAMGIGGYLFEISGREISIELRYNFDVSDSFPQFHSIQARNRALEILMGINFQKEYP